MTGGTASPSSKRSNCAPSIVSTICRCSAIRTRVARRVLADIVGPLVGRVGEGLDSASTSAAVNSEKNCCRRRLSDAA